MESFDPFSIDIGHWWKCRARLFSLHTSLPLKQMNLNSAIWLLLNSWSFMENFFSSTGSSWTSSCWSDLILYRFILINFFWTGFYWACSSWMGMLCTNLFWSRFFWTGIFWTCLSWAFWKRFILYRLFRKDFSEYLVLSRFIQNKWQWDTWKLAKYILSEQSGH